jgi:hypothetical protein
MTSWLQPNWMAVAMIALCVGGFACAAHQFDPMPLDRGAAAAAGGGVRLVADTNEWRREPLAPGLMPLQITVENGSERSVRISYGNVTLAAPGGARLHPLPPFDLGQKNPPIPERYAYPWYAFHVAPHLALFYRGFWLGSAATAPDAEQFARGYRELTARMAPTQTMRRCALPEGVLGPGGYITGMLYFAATPRTGASLVVRLIDGSSGDPFATLEVPLRVTG